jgi:PASTA domain/TIR domain
MRAIFISYRREDAEGEAGRLFDDLVGVFGEDSVFMDVAAIDKGIDFRKAIDDNVSTCGVLLAIIGKDWVDAKNEAGQRRLDDAADFVRLETGSALKRDIPVIPVLVHGARMPRAEQLPDDLKNLVYRNGVELTGARWRSDVQALIQSLRPHVGETKSTPEVQGQVAAQPAMERAAPVRVPAPTPRREVAISSPAEKKPLGLILGVAAAVVVIGAVLVYMMMPKQVVVPDLTGMTLPDATAKLQSLNLVVGRRTTKEAPAKDPNTVLNQSPAPNSRVNSGTAINLVIATEGARVPSQGDMRPQPPNPKEPECAPTYWTENTPRYRVLYVWSSDRSALGADVFLDGKCQGRIESHPGSPDVYAMFPVLPGSYNLRIQRKGFPDFERTVKAAPPAVPPAQAAKIPVQFSLTPR